MTKLYVKEFKGLAATRQSDSVLAFPADNSPADQVVDFTAGAANSAPFQKGTEWVLLSADAGCSILVQAAAGAQAPTVANFRLPGNTPLPFRVPGDGSYLVSAITNP
jgi:hypothetical protein